MKISITMSAKTRSEKRKANKPLMEKRRRARINSSLTVLKNLILQDSQEVNGVKSVTSQSRLEKADILELAVVRMRQLQKEKETNINHLFQSAPFKAGYEACLREVEKILAKQPAVPDNFIDQLSSRLVSSPVDCPEPGSPKMFCGRNDMKVSPTRLPDGRLALVFSAESLPEESDSNDTSAGNDSEPVWRPWCEKRV